MDVHEGALGGRRECQSPGVGVVNHPSCILETEFQSVQSSKCSYPLTSLQTESPLYIVESYLFAITITAVLLVVCGVEDNSVEWVCSFHLYKGSGD